jgi:hypothetical protein
VDSGHLALAALVTGIKVSTKVRPCNGQLIDNLGDVIAVVITMHEKLFGRRCLHPVSSNVKLMPMHAILTTTLC